jgi:hypothetical protein
VSGSWLALCHRIAITKIKMIFEVLASGLTQRIDVQYSQDNILLNRKMLVKVIWYVTALYLRHVYT